MLYFTTVGSISDPELTKVSSFLTNVSAGVSIMADRGFTIKDLSAVGADLNLPPFLHGKTQLSTDEVKVASLRIHVKHAIGCMKHFLVQ